MDGYPLTLRVLGRRVLVVGGGRVAARRLPRLLAAGADVLVVDPDPGEQVRELAAAGQVALARRPYRDGDLDGVWLVHTCAGDPAVNAAVAAAADAARVWCVRADDRTAATAWTPAVGDHDGVTVAVTAGGDPGRAAAVRDGTVAALRAGLVAAPRRRGRGDRVASPANDCGRVALVGGGPGDPGLVTVRGRLLLAAADVVVTDRLAPRALLEELPPDVEIIEVGKARGTGTSQEEINGLLVAKARAGLAVVRLKGGDPFVYGRGAEEAIACAEAGVPCEIVPGVTSAVAVPAAAGIPLTHRGLAQEVVIASGHLPPGHPKDTVDWAWLAASRATLVLLMAVDTLPAIAAELVSRGRPGSTPAACIQDGTTPHQRVVTATLDGIAAAAAAAMLRPPAVVVIGDVVALRGAVRPGTDDSAVRSRPGGA